MVWLTITILIEEGETMNIFLVNQERVVKIATIAGTQEDGIAKIRDFCLERGVKVKKLETYSLVCGHIVDIGSHNYYFMMR